MRNDLIAFVGGVVFAIGLAISGMTDPAKIIGFLDVTGAWDASLGFVMGGAVGIYAAVYWLAMRRGSPVFALEFSLPLKNKADPRLVTGAAIFGIGWGMAGFCPGPAIVSVVTGTSAVVAFVAAMLLGMFAHNLVTRRLELSAQQS